MLHLSSTLVKDVARRTLILPIDFENLLGTILTDVKAFLAKVGLQEFGIFILMGSINEEHFVMSLFWSLVVENPEIGADARSIEQIARKCHDAI